MSLTVVRTFLWASCLLLLTACAGADLRYRIIPNQFVILVAACGFTLSFLPSPGSAWISILISLGLFFALATLAHYNVLGGGDAKLIAAVALLVPPDRVGLLLMEIALAGGLLSGAYLVASWALRRTAVPKFSSAGPCSTNGARFLDDERARIITGQSVPYALAILGGVGFFVLSELYQCLSGTHCSL